MKQLLCTNPLFCREERYKGNKRKKNIYDE